MNASVTAEGHPYRTKRRPISRYTVFSALLFAAAPQAANYEGIYLGGFNGPTDDGAFAVLVKNNNQAVLMAYDSIDDFGFINESITVNSDGSFAKTNVDGEGANVSGTVTDLTISGSYTAPYGNGTFSGSKQSYNGPIENGDGYYKGTFSTSCPSFGINGSGYFRSIVSADGYVYVYTQYTSSNSSHLSVGSKDGGILTVSGSSIYGYTVNGADVTGTVNGTLVSGSFSFTGCSGTFSGSLNYALNASDADSDKIADNNDNCPDVANATQVNSDSDSYGDACDAFPNDSAEYLDSDADTIGDNADNCPADYNPTQQNSDADSSGGDACDTDDDNDNVPDTSDNCPLISNADQLNTDGLSDGGDACDADDDQDGFTDAEEAEAGTDPLDAGDFPVNTGFLQGVLPLILE